MAKTQRVDLQQRADALLDAAAELMLSGCEPVRVEEIAARAGVGKGTVYLHWSSREHVFLAVAAREAAAMLDTVIAAVERDPQEAAPHRFVRRHFMEAMQRPVLRKIFVADEPGPAAFQQARATLRASKLFASRSYIGALSEQDLLRPDLDLADVAYGLRAIAFGFFTGPSGDSRVIEHRADQLADVVRRSFEPEPAPPTARYSAAAPQAVAAFASLAAEFRATAYSTDELIHKGVKFICPPTSPAFTILDSLSAIWTPLAKPSTASASPSINPLIRLCHHQATHSRSAPEIPTPTLPTTSSR